ncbi:MAG TPA: TonB-dependent receptor [Novosphingobium sp.]|nr:TonB-dependent receptor [Novosphingobium sp.]
MKYSVSVVALAIAVLPAAAFANAAPAGNAEAGAGDPDAARIVVTARLEKTAREEQLAALNLINVQSAEAIAKYPDVNAAEALSRIPGVALSIDTAEGRFVNIRGLDGNLNGATMGGVVLLNTQPGGTYFNAAGRAVEFDTVPIGAIDKIMVTKTGRPDSDAEGIGGSVELTPRSAIGLSRMFYDVTLGGGMETIKGKGFYREEVVIGGPIGGANSPVSFVVSQYLHNDHRSFYDIEEGYVDGQPAVPDKAFAGLELRNYDYYRQRFGYSGEIDYVPATGQRYYLRASLAGYNEHVYRNRFEIDYDGNAVVNPANAKGLIDTATAVKTLRDEDETHKNLVTQIGGDNRLGRVRLEYWGAYSRATFDKHFDYNSTFANANGYTIAYDNTSNPDYPTYAVTAGSGLLDPTQYALSKIANATEHDKDEEWSAAVAVSLPAGLVAGDELKLGGKLRLRNKTANPYTANYSYTGTLSLAQDSGGTSITNFYNAGYNIMPQIGGDALRKLYAASGTSLALNPGGYFNDDENIVAGFAQYKADIGKLGVLAGLRFEHTDATYRGIGSVTDASGNTTALALSTKHSYSNVFPSLQLRYKADDRLLLRAVYSTGLARPGFYQTQQSTSVDQGALTVSTGNPALKPTFSHNFDLTVEYYLPHAGIVSLGLFDKEMKDYIVTRTHANTTYPGYSGLYTVQSFENAPSAYARGIEANYVNQFTSLPGWLGGFGIDANATYVKTGVNLRAGDGTIALPGAFPWSWNAAVFYEKGKMKLRLASQFESSVLFGAGSSRATDVYQDSRYTMDFSASYDIAKSAQLYLNIKNLTNAPLRFYEGSPDRPIQREFYDLTLETGLKLKF